METTGRGWFCEGSSSSSLWYSVMVQMLGGRFFCGTKRKENKNEKKGRGVFFSRWWSGDGSRFPPDTDSGVVLMMSLLNSSSGQLYTLPLLAPTRSGEV